MVPPGQPRSYYGEPVLATPVWAPEIPAYFFAGGVAGAAAPLAFFAHSSGNDVLARRAAMVALTGALVSPPLLIKDLGKPIRFLYMLRVFKVTSPMSVGSWILAAFGPCAALSAASEMLDVFPRVGRAAQAAGLVLGPLLGTYTAALIANTAVPIWHDARRELPFVFGASAVATAGAATGLVTAPSAGEPAWRMAIGGAVVELIALQVMERRLGWIAEPYHRGRPSLLARSGKALTAAGAGAVLGKLVQTRAWRGGRTVGDRVLRRRRVAPSADRISQVGGAAILAGGLLGRWAIFRAGFDSSADPRYTVKPQRERVKQAGSAAEIGGTGFDKRPAADGSGTLQS